MDKNSVRPSFPRGGSSTRIFTYVPFAGRLALILSNVKKVSGRMGPPAWGVFMDRAQLDCDDAETYLKREALIAVDVLPKQPARARRSLEYAFSIVRTFTERTLAVDAILRATAPLSPEASSTPREDLKAWRKAAKLCALLPQDPAQARRVLELVAVLLSLSLARPMPLEEELRGGSPVEREAAPARLRLLHFFPDERAAS